MRAERQGIRWARLAAAVVALVAMLGACDHSPRGPSDGRAPSADAVVVASFNFPESELLAEIYAQAIERAGVPVRREFDLGPRELVQPAQRQGLIDVVPEYLGAALASITPQRALDWTDPQAVLAALRQTVAPWDLQVLEPSAASDQDGFAVTHSTADRLHLRTLSDLAAVAPRLTIGGPTECPQRPYCLAGLERVYGVHVKQFLPFDDQAQRAAALDEGVIDVAVTFTTDGQLATGRRVLLQDDRHLQPTDLVTPMVSARALSRYGAPLRYALNAVSATLDTRSLIFLNWRVGLADKTIQAEARGWLDRQIARAAG
jgi:osmoprotectant transport system substrate-binding protein